MDTGYFHLLAIVNNTAVDAGVHVSFQSNVFTVSVYTSNSGID